MSGQPECPPGVRDLPTLVFGHHVRSLRRARGYTQGDLADRCGLSTDTIRRIERGGFSPSLDTLHKLCQGLQLRLGTLFTGLEFGEFDVAREIADLVASRPEMDQALAYQLVRDLFRGLDNVRSQAQAQADDGSDNTDG